LSVVSETFNIPKSLNPFLNPKSKILNPKSLLTMAIAEEKILAALREVQDPELLVNIVDLGLVYGVGVEEVEGKTNIRALVTMTTPACPFGPELLQEIKAALERLENVGRVEVQLTLSPPWTPDRMTEDARDELGMF
jgi:metal-sulfur cluster biosynthetic enzyme